MKRIAAFLPNWIGDVVMATPAIRALREHFRQAELIAVCKSYVADTLAGSPWFDDTLRFDKSPRRSWEIIQSLRSAPLDAAVLFPNTFRSALMAAAGGARQIVGFARYGRDLLLTRRLYAPRDHRGRYKPVPAIDEYNRIVRLLGVPDPGYRMELHTTAIDEAAADQVWSQLGLHHHARVIALNTGGAFGAAKDWPLAHFVELAQALASRPDTGVLVLCGPKERANAAEVVRLAGRPSVVSLADSPMSLGLSKAVVRRCHLLITTDSGPRHFAAAFGRPVITLFGPTHIGWTETYYPQAVHLQKAVPCGPCQLRVCPLDHRCMTTLSPAEVLVAARRFLDRDAGITEESQRQERRHAG